MCCSGITCVFRSVNYYFALQALYEILVEVKQKQATFHVPFPSEFMEKLRRKTVRLVWNKNTQHRYQVSSHCTHLRKLFIFALNNASTYIKYRSTNLKYLVAYWNSFRWGFTRGCLSIFYIMWSTTCEWLVLAQSLETHPIPALNRRYLAKL